MTHAVEHAQDHFWSDHLATLLPYVPGEQPKENGLLKLNTNENPYGPSPRALQAIQAHLNEDLRLYPDPESGQLRQALAQGWGVTPDQVFVGNGSDEVLAHVFYSFFLRDARPVLLPSITYNFYQSWCRLYNVPQQVIPLTEDFRISVQDYLDVAAKLTAANTPPAAIIFANPNAPTGIALAQDDIEHLLQALPDTLIVVDEAYVGFGTDSVVDLLAHYDNLLLTHTFSKTRALAGLRIGYVLAHPHLINALGRTKNSFNAYPLDTLAQAGAIAAIEDREHFDRTRQLIIQTREHLRSELLALGFDVLPSQANFLFARHPAHSGAALAQALREHKILVRRFAQPRIEDFLRITIGTQGQCEYLTQTLHRIIRAA